MTHYMKQCLSHVGSHVSNLNPLETEIEWVVSVRPSWATQRDSDSKQTVQKPKFGME